MNRPAAIRNLLDARTNQDNCHALAAKRIATELPADIDAMTDEEMDAHFLAEEKIRKACGCYDADSAVVHWSKVVVNVAADEVARNRMIPATLRKAAKDAAAQPGSRAWRMFLANVEKWGSRPMQGLA